MNGIIVVDKPEGWTSQDVCAKLRGVLRERRVGHSGTLDPMATGVLPVFVGRATRAVEFAENDRKRYIARLRPGLVTDTQDVTGSVLEKRTADITSNDVLAVLPEFTGEIQQVPPMYSAVKIGGRRLYDIARQGGTVERPARRVTIHSLELIGMEDGDYVLDITCSKGTYIRTLCHDLGLRLGCGGCMAALRRVRAGAFDISDARPLSEIVSAGERGALEGILLPVDSLFSDRPSVAIDERSEKKCRCGNDFPVDVSDGVYRVYSKTGEFLMLGNVTNRKMKTVKSFFAV